MPHIHSKGVAYTNNGSGRDTYISDCAGGLRAMYKPSHGKRTFYNNLRQYDQRHYQFGKRGSSHTATMMQRKDTFGNSQNHFNSKYVRELKLVQNYQQQMDQRLSQPKTLQMVPDNRQGRVYKNSAADHQKRHQSTFYRTGNNFQSTGSLS